MLSFGIAALVLAITGIFVPFGYFVSALSALLAFLSAGRGTALGVASVIINITNIYILSPSLLLIVAPSRIARKSQALSDQEMLFMVLVLIQIAAATFLAAHWFFSSIEDNEEDENGITVQNAIKSFAVLLLGIISISSVALAGKTVFEIKNSQKYTAAKAAPEQPAVIKTSAAPINTGKSWAQHGFSKEAEAAEPEDFSGEPFTFDIWEAGMDEVDLLKTAKRNGINLFDEENSYRYSTKLLEEYAMVHLHLTAKTRRLMSVSVRWNSGRKVRDIVLEMLESQNAERFGKVYKINGRTEVELKSIVGIDLEMIYKDLALMRADMTERRVKREEVKRDTIAKEGGRFFKRNAIEAKDQVQESNAAVYQITGENGKITYTNDPAKAASQKGSRVDLKPLETVPLKEVVGYVIHLKNGRTEKVKKASSDGSRVWFKNGPIETVMPIGEIRGVKELYRTGEETGSQYLDFRAGF